MTTSADNPFEVSGIFKEVWLHFKKSAVLKVGHGTEPMVDVPMARLTAAQARDVAAELLIYAQQAEEHAVEWKCCLSGCPIRIHTVEQAAIPACQRHGKLMIRIA